MTSVWKGLRYRTVNGHGEKPYSVKVALSSPELLPATVSKNLYA